MPNNTVSAAGEAMPAAEGMQIVTGRFSRRAMLVGAIASLPAIAAATAAPAVSTVVDIHPDAELFRLDAEMERLNAWADQLGRDLARIEDLVAEGAGPRPMPPSDWKWPEVPDDIREMRKAVVVKRIMADDDTTIEYPVPVQEWDRAALADRDRVQAEWDAYRDRLQAQNQLHGLEAKEAEDTQCAEAEWETCQRIFETPAHTLDGMAIKIRAGGKLDLEKDALASIADDIRRLAAGAA
ncbi:hypothetical protein MPL3356_390177 [Mesorhizobium plurifarium]|uniref:Uncharacterized protein n=1 Tax=Mesorhizobium plurifarium TaxID=69974 RepID=A0A090E4R0_MESPL|nr:hypothetical protein MPL3356_390177 [Mesorhizobium plurifarium]